VLGIYTKEDYFTASGVTIDNQEKAMLTHLAGKRYKIYMRSCLRLEFLSKTQWTL